MGASKIEQLIEDIYEFMESCKMQPLSSTKVIVPKDELYDLLDELRLRTPDEIKRYQKIISNRDAIIQDAQEKAETMMAEAREHTATLINEHEIMQKAYYQANEIVNQANEEAQRIIRSAQSDANQIRMGSLGYTDDMLSQLEALITNALESTKTKSDQLITSLKGNLDIVSNNKKEICDQLYDRPQEPVREAAVSGDSYQEDEFDFDENTFLDGVEQ